MTPTDDHSEPETPPRERDTIVIEDDLLREGFTQVPNLLLKRTDLSHGAKIAYAMLLAYAWGTEKCFPGQARLAADMGVERKAVIRYLQELKDKDFITVTRRGMGKTNVYTLPRLADVPKMGQPDVPPMGQPDVRSMGQKEYPEKKTKNDEYLSNFEGSHDDGPRNERTDATQHDRRQGTGADRLMPLGEILQLRAPVNRGDPPEHASTAPDDEPRPTRPEHTAEASAERERLRPFLEDFARELGDQAPLSSTITRTRTIFTTAGISPERWSDYLYQARGLTQEHTAQIRKVAGERASGLRRKNKMPYFLATLEQLVGLRPASAPPPTKRRDISQ